jgi:hypothetical protein
MKTHTPCWPLFRNELCLDHFAFGPWLLVVSLALGVWLLGGAIPLLLLFKGAEGNLATFFTAFGDLAGFAFVWWLAITGAMFAFATLPGLSNPVQGVQAFEFMFTRAVDRRRLFRVRSATIALFLLGPLLINLLLAACRPAATYSPDPSQPELGAARQEHYQRAFPHGQVDATPGRPPRLVIPGAALTLTAWILWLGTLSLLLMQCYCVLLAHRVQNRPWLAGAAIAAPIIVAFALAPRLPRLLPDWFESGFLYFAQHRGLLLFGLLVLILALQRFSERQFDRLEIL